MTSGSGIFSSLSGFFLSFFLSFLFFLDFSSLSSGFFSPPKIEENMDVKPLRKSPSKAYVLLKSLDINFCLHLIIRSHGLLRIFELLFFLLVFFIFLIFVLTGENAYGTECNYKPRHPHLAIILSRKVILI